MYFGYSGNENEVRKMRVGDIVSELGYYSKQPCEGYASRAEYWKSYMTEEQLKEKENTLLLLDEEGKTNLFEHIKNLTYSISRHSPVLMRIEIFIISVKHKDKSRINRQIYRSLHHLVHQELYQ